MKNPSRSTENEAQDPGPARKKSGRTLQKNGEALAGQISRVRMQVEAGQALGEDRRAELARECQALLGTLDRRTVRRAPAEEARGPEVSHQGDPADALPLFDDGVEYVPVPVANPFKQPPPAATRPPWEDPIYDNLSPEKKAIIRRTFEAIARSRPEQPAPGPLPAALVFEADDICCTSVLPRQIGLLGHQRNGRSVAVDLYRPIALTLVGPPGTGKSYTAGVIIENVTMKIRGANNLRARYCTISLHYYPSSNYASEMLESVLPAEDPDQLKLLARLDLEPQGHPDTLVLTLSDHVPEMRKKHRHAQVHGLKFRFAELSNQGLRIVLGLDQKQSPMYAREVSKMLRELLGRKRQVTFQDLWDAAEAYDFSAGVKPLVLRRLELCRPWIDDGRSLRGLIRPGRHIIVEICSEWLTEEEAMMLFALVTEVLVLSAGNSEGSKRCPLLLCYDEAHLFARWPIVARQMDLVLRQRRHLLTSVLLASQDPLSIPAHFLPLMDGIGVFQNHTEEWLQFLRKKIKAFAALCADDFARLKPGQMWFWSRAWHACTELEPEGEEAHEDEHEEDETVPCKLCQMMAEEEDGAGEDEDEEDEEEEEDDEDDDDRLDGTSVVIITVRPRVTCHGGDTTTAEPEDGAEAEDEGWEEE